MTLTVAATTLVATAAVTLASAIAITVGHALWRRRRDRRLAATRALALDFAGFLTGRLGQADLRARAASSRPAVFWAALEGIAENIDGAEWSRLSSALLDLAPVAREERRIRRGSAWRRALAARRLGMLDARRLREPLRRAVTRGPEMALLPAALALARVQDLPTLVWLLAHPERSAHLGRHVMAVVLLRFGTEAPPALRRAVERRRPSGLPVELAAIDVLGLGRDEASCDLLEGLVANPDVEVRVTAVRALGRIASPRSAPCLTRALDDTFWQVRAQAARALGEIGSVEAVLPLARLTGDSSWWVRRRAAYALGAIGTEGRAALAGIEHGNDRYAADFAAEVLQALEWERERPGGLRRVD